MPLRIAFFGLPLAALLLHADGHELVVAGLCREAYPGERRLRRALGSRVLLKPPVRDARFVEKVREARPDLLVSWFWTNRLPPALLRTAPLGGVGVHPSLLPRHRGPDPTYWALRSGDAESGVTAHRLEAEYDTGAILGVERLAIRPDWNAWQLAKALDRPSLRLLRATVGRFARGESVDEVSQDEALATAAPAPSDEDCALVWTRSSVELERQVRALAPAPGAFTEIGGRCVVLTRVRVSANAPAALLPGEGAVVEGLPLVRTGDGALALLEGEIDGEPAGPSELGALFASSSSPPLLA